MQRLFNPIFRNRRFFCSKVSDLKAEVQEIVKIFNIRYFRSWKKQPSVTKVPLNWRRDSPISASTVLIKSNLYSILILTYFKIVAMEERFSLDINNEEAEKIATVNDAVDIFARYMTEKINRE